MTMTNAKFEEELTLNWIQNWHEEFDEIWPEQSKVLKICILMDSFWTKYIKLKTCREPMFHDTEE